MDTKAVPSPAPAAAAVIKEEGAEEQPKLPSVTNMVARMEAAMEKPAAALPIVPGRSAVVKKVSAVKAPVVETPPVEAPAAPAVVETPAAPAVEAADVGKRFCRAGKLLHWK